MQNMFSSVLAQNNVSLSHRNDNGQLDTAERHNNITEENKAMFLKQDHLSNSSTTPSTLSSGDHIPWFGPDEIRHDIQPGQRGPPDWQGLNKGHENVKVHNDVPDREAQAPASLDWDASDDREFPNVISFIIAGFVIAIIVAALIGFLFVRRRRNSSPKRKLFVPVHDEEDGQLTNTTVSFKTEEESLGFQDICYEISKDSAILGKINPSFILYPRYGSNSSYNRASQAGTIILSPEGGIFQQPRSNITVSIPKNVTSSIPKIAIVNGPPRNVPHSIAVENILSDMITLLPHGAALDKHILVSFPVKMNKVDNISKLQLMYSNTDIGEEPHWINLKQNKTPIKHQDALCWFISDGYCYLYANHFCHVFLTQNCTLLEQPALFLQASVHGRFMEEANKMVLRVGFHCNKCNPTILENKNDWGALLWSGYRCIYGKEGMVNVSIQMHNNQWIGPKTKQDVDVDDLLNLCNLNDIYPPHTFTYKSANDVTWGDLVLMQVVLSQGQRKHVQEIEETINNMVIAERRRNDSVVFERTQSDPVEHSDNSLEPVENHDSSQDDIIYSDENENVVFRSSSVTSDNENTNIISQQSNCENNTPRSARNAGPCENDDVTEILSDQVRQEIIHNDETQIVPFVRKGDAIFNENILDEEIRLCTLMRPANSAKAPYIIKTVCETESNIDTKNFDGDMILRMWGIKVKMNTKTWDKLRNILLDLKLNKIVAQLNVSVDKNKLIYAINGLKAHLKLEPLLTKLVQQRIVTPSDANRMRLIENSDNTHGKWIEYLVYNVLCRQPISSLYAFYDVVQNIADYTHLLQPLQLLQR